MEDPVDCGTGAPHPESEYVVTILPGRIRITVRTNETIVDALRRQGYRTRYKCRRGGCGACRATLIDGQITYVAHVSAPVIEGSDETLSTGKCLPCRAAPTCDSTIELGPRDHVVDVFPIARTPRPAPPSAPPSTPANT
ncbi:MULTISPECIES: 2Fe-2S iron-sulfur cluster-binding protein [Rhodococcus]|uniref:2Fe-2S iron-sulfur cluster-binding protein n=1 Tax=Rhodococcus TaxID=1827 RepID=UPI0022866F4C|nr:2Fe-2S iron-sulfur cluster-binding protein [Rhodococcus sp. JS3073]WAM11908.1 2Fe-2S iron-sulfur cluster-binding protein [Rhodococcus sp. JS3073]